MAFFHGFPCADSAAAALTCRKGTCSTSLERPGLTLRQSDNSPEEDRGVLRANDPSMGDITLQDMRNTRTRSFNAPKLSKYLHVSQVSVDHLYRAQLLLRMVKLNGKLNVRLTVTLACATQADNGAQASQPAHHDCERGGLSERAEQQRLCAP